MFVQINHDKPGCLVGQCLISLSHKSGGMSNYVQIDIEHIQLIWDMAMPALHPQCDVTVIRDLSWRRHQP